MGKLRKRIRKAEGNGSMEQYNTACVGAAQGECQRNCNSFEINNYAMALVRQNNVPKYKS